jgi:hypothetical protein
MIKALMLITYIHHMQYHSLSRDNSVGDALRTPAFSWESPGFNTGSLKFNAGPQYNSGGYIGGYGSGTAAGVSSPPIHNSIEDM